MYAVEPTESYYYLDYLEEKIMQLMDLFPWTCMPRMTLKGKYHVALPALISQLSH